MEKTEVNVRFAWVVRMSGWITDRSSSGEAAGRETCGERVATESATGDWGPKRLGKCHASFPFRRRTIEGRTANPGVGESTFIEPSELRALSANLD